MLTDARLRDTHLERANLTGAAGLTWEQGQAAFTDQNTILPDYLTVGHCAAPAYTSRVQLPPPPPPPAAPAAPAALAAPRAARTGT
jgi:hypothetical protein